MRTRGLAILTVAVLAFSACNSAAAPSGSAAPPASVAPGVERTGHQRGAIDGGRRRRHRYAPDALAR